MMNDDNLLICRCEEVSLREIKDAIDQGAMTLDEVKRRTRAGMGLCQGKTCGRLIARIIADRTDQSVDDVLPATSRPPVRPVPLGVIAATEKSEDAS
jgi:NAD(P)H-nitrite reductase large subunit